MKNSKTPKATSPLIAVLWIVFLLGNLVTVTVHGTTHPGVNGASHEGRESQTVFVDTIAAKRASSGAIQI